MPTGRDFRRISRDVITVEGPPVCVFCLPWFSISKSEDAAVRDDFPSINRRPRRRSGPGLAENVQSFERPSTRIASPVIQRALSEEGDGAANVVRLNEALRRLKPQLQHCQTRQPALLWQIRRRAPDHPVVVPPHKCCMKTNGTGGRINDG